MSRGPGGLQRRLLLALAHSPEDQLPRSALYQVFSEADPSNLRRALRGLNRIGLISERYHPEVIDPITRRRGVRWVVLFQPRPVPNKVLAARYSRCPLSNAKRCPGGFQKGAERVPADNFSLRKRPAKTR